jgi:hypothetical protein
VKKNRLEFKKNRPVQLGFISLKPKKPNRTQTEKNPEKKPSKTKKPSQTGLNWFLSLKNRTETSQFEPVLVFFF